MFRCFDVSMFRCFDVSMFRCFDLKRAAKYDLYKFKNKNSRNTVKHHLLPIITTAQLFTTSYNILQHLTTFYNILQHIPKITSAPYTTHCTCFPNRFRVLPFGLLIYIPNLSLSGAVAIDSRWARLWRRNGAGRSRWLTGRYYRK